MTYFSKKKVKSGGQNKNNTICRRYNLFHHFVHSISLQAKKVLKRNDQRRNMDITKYTLYKF